MAAMAFYSRKAALEVGLLAARHALWLAQEVDRNVDAQAAMALFVDRCYQEPALQLRPPSHTSFGSPVFNFSRRNGYLARFQYFHLQRAYRWRRARLSGMAQVNFKDGELVNVSVLSVRR